MTHDIIMGIAVQGSSIVEYLQPTAFLRCWPTEDDGKVCGEKMLVNYVQATQRREEYTYVKVWETTVRPANTQALRITGILAYYHRFDFF